MKNFITILKNDVPALMHRVGLIDAADPWQAAKVGVSRALIVQAAVLAGYTARTAQRRIRDLIDQDILRTRPDGRLICRLWVPDLWTVTVPDDAEA